MLRGCIVVGLFALSVYILPLLIARRMYRLSTVEIRLTACGQYCRHSQTLLLMEWFSFSWSLFFSR